MSRPIDEKIVRMKLDSTQFQSNANKTIGIFSKLQNVFSRVKNLNLTPSVKSLSDVQSAAGKVDFNRMATGIESINSKFSAMGVVAATVLSNITTKLMSVGAGLAKAAFIEPLTTGFNEYELKMKSIQTILSNTQGKSNLQDVTKTLDELNTYADKTIYSFADMTHNIGQFTTAGVGLEDSATAIQGIANLAAVSGSNTQQASSAMYQLSQALSSGKVSLMDWNSVVNAGMGGKVFQNALEETADKLGTGRDMSVSFRDSLEDGWLTTDVLLSTLQDFAKDDSMLEAATKVRTFTQMIDTTKEALGSGWAQTWETLIGDFNEAGTMWTKANDALSGIIGGMSDSRNQVAKYFVKLGGTEKIIHAIINAFRALVTVGRTVGGAFKNVFGNNTDMARNLVSMADGIYNFSKKLQMSKETAAKVGTVFQGIFTVFKIGINIVKAIGEALTGMVPKGLGTGLLDFAVKISELIISFEKGMTSSNAFKKTISGVADVIKTVASGIWQLAQGIGDIIAQLYEGSMGVFDKIGPTFTKITDSISKFMGSFKLKDAAGLGILGLIFAGIKKLLTVKDDLFGFTDSIKGFLDSFSGAFGSIKDAVANLGGLTDALKTMTDGVKAKTLFTIAAAVGVLALSLKLMSGIKGQDIFKSLQVLGLALIGIVKTLGAISAMDFTGASAFKASAILISISGAVLVLAIALKVISTIDAADMLTSLITLVTIVGTLVVALNSLSKHSGKIMTSSVSMMALSVAILILAGAVKVLSTIDAAGLTQGVIALGVIFLELGIFLAIVDKSKLNMGSAVSLVIISGAVLVMVAAIKQIAEIPVDILIKGLATIGAILLGMAAFVKLAGGAKVMSAAMGMVTVAIGINMLVGPIKELGAMDTGQLAQGLITLGLALAGIVVAMQMAKGGLFGAAAIMAVAIAINLLVPSLVALANLNPAQVATALITLAGAFIIIGVAAAVLGPVGSVSLIAFALGIGAVALAIGAVGVVMLGFAAALTALAGLTVAGIASIVGSLGLLLVGLVTIIPQAVNFLVTLVVEMAKGLVAAVPVLVDSAGQLIVALLQALVTYVPQFVELGMQFVTGLITAFAENIGPLIEAGVNLVVQLVSGMANSIRENAQPLVEALLNMVEAMMEVIIQAITQVIDVIFGWIPGVSEATKGLGDAATNALREAFNIETIGTEKGAAFVGGIESNNPNSMLAGAGLATNADDGAGSIDLLNTGDILGKSFATGVGGTTDSANAEGTKIAQNADKGAASIDLSPTGKGSGDAYSSGVSSTSGTANTAGTGIANDAKSGAGSVEFNSTGSASGSQYSGGVSSQSGSARTSGSGLSYAAKAGASSVSLNETGANLGRGLRDGISSMVDGVQRAASGLASAAKSAVEAVLAIFSPSRVMYQDGVYTGQGLAMGIDSQTDNVYGSAEGLGEAAISAVKSYAGAFSDAMLEDIEMSPVITPILDLGKMDKFDLSKRVPVGSINFDNANVRGVKANSASNIQNNNNYNITVALDNSDPAMTQIKIERLAKQVSKAIQREETRRTTAYG